MADRGHTTGSAVPLHHGHTGSTLMRTLALPGAIMVGLGSIIGTGVFVTLALATGLAGYWVIAALVAAAFLALMNGLSSVQLASLWPVSGGTYEYAWRALNPLSGFAAGWMFLCAKSASLAAAALGLAGYAVNLAGMGDGSLAQKGVAASLVLALTVITAGGLKRSNSFNAGLIVVTIGGLLVFAAALVLVQPADLITLGASAALTPAPTAFFEATALLFVAYTGYGRIATMGEEIIDPARNIPRTLFWTLGITLGLYLCVAGSVLWIAGPDTFAAAFRRQGSSLLQIAEQSAIPGLPWLISLACLTALAGVILNLLLGISRVLLAMARRGDLPVWLAVVSHDGRTPHRAVWCSGLMATMLTILMDIRLSWSFSAFTILLYYGLTNACILRLPTTQLKYPRWTAWMGLGICLSLVAFISREAMFQGMLLLCGGFLVRFLFRRVPD